MRFASDASDETSPIPSRLTDSHVGVLRWQDERAVAALLARAFVDDPLVMAICDTPRAERQRRMAWGFRVAVRAHCLARQPAWTIENRDATPLGIALVTRQQAAEHLPPASDSLFALRGFWHVGLRAAFRGIQAAQTIAAHLPLEPFTYLRTLGVEPVWHRQGVGSQLVEQVISAARQSLPIYLETAKERNLSFYSGHGFDCIGTFDCLDVRIWRLWRAPRE